MKDFVCNEYCDYLWINDLLSLKKGNKNEFEAVVKESGEDKIVKVVNVIVYGVVVETKQIGEKGILYSIDDGTGIITCKYNEQMFTGVLDLLQEEQTNVLNESFRSRTENDSQLDYSVASDDSIFNDRSLQEEEESALKRNRLKALHSVWSDIEASFSCMTGIINVGDSVLIQGRLYNYFNTNQIHVNTIRPLELKEQLMLTKYKLDDGYEPLTGATEQNSEISSVVLVENDRKSGRITFDNIHHLEACETGDIKLIASDDGSSDAIETNTRKKKSIVPPQLQGGITFDTFVDVDECDVACKKRKLDDDSVDKVS